MYSNLNSLYFGKWIILYVSVACFLLKRTVALILSWDLIYSAIHSFKWSLWNSAGLMTIRRSDGAVCMKIMCINWNILKVALRIMTITICIVLHETENVVLIFQEIEHLATIKLYWRDSQCTLAFGFFSVLIVDLDSGTWILFLEFWKEAVCLLHIWSVASHSTQFYSKGTTTTLLV